MGCLGVVLGGKGVVLGWVGRDRKGRGGIEGHGGIGRDRGEGFRGVMVGLGVGDLHSGEGGRER